MPHFQIKWHICFLGGVVAGLLTYGYSQSATGRRPMGAAGCRGRFSVDNKFTSATGALCLSLPISSIHAFVYNTTSANVPTSLSGSVTASSGTPDIVTGGGAPDASEPDFCMNVITEIPTSPFQGGGNSDGQASDLTNGAFASFYQVRGKEMQLAIYPNPFVGTTNISYSLPEGCGYAIFNIIDETGKQVNSIMLSGSTQGGKCTLDAGNMRPGIYHDTVTANDNRLKTGNFVIAGQ